MDRILDRRELHPGYPAVPQRRGEVQFALGPGGVEGVLVTFEPHPLEIVNPTAAPPLLTVGARRVKINATSDREGVKDDAATLKRFGWGLGWLAAFATATAVLTVTRSCCIAPSYVNQGSNSSPAWWYRSATYLSFCTLP